MPHTNIMFDHIGNIVGKFSKKIEGPNSARAEQIVEVMRLMAEDEHDSRRFKYWLGRTKHLSPDDIYGMRKQAQSGTNPQALFNYLIKQSCKRKI